MKTLGLVANDLGCSFMRKLYFLIFLLCASVMGSAIAYAETTTKEFQTRFGLLLFKYNRDVLTYDEVKQEQMVHSDLVVDLNGEQIAVLPIRSHIVKILEWGNKADLAIIDTYSGRGCCSYRVLEITADGHALTREFGHHGREPSDFSVQADEITFRLKRDYPPDIDHWIVHYSGQEPVIEVVMEDDSNVPMAGAGDDVTRWQGTKSHFLLENADERVRFAQIMGVEHMNTLRSTQGLSAQMERRNGVLFGSGCRVHDCITGHGYIAIDIETGRPFAAYFNDDCTLTSFGAPEAELPAPMREQITAYRAELRKHSDNTLNFKCSGYATQFINYPAYIRE